MKHSCLKIMLFLPRPARVCVCVCCSLSLQLFMSRTGKIISPYEFFFRFVGGLYRLAEIVNSLISSNSPYNCIITCEYETRGSSFAVTVRISLDLFRPKLYNISLAVTHTNVCKPTVYYGRKDGGCRRG